MRSTTNKSLWFIYHRVVDVQPSNQIILTAIFVFLFFFRTEEREAYSKNNWHRILVTKPQLRELVQGCIIAGDRLMVNGVITYLPFATDNGKFRQRAAILARELFRCNDGLEASPDAYDKSESDTTLG